MEISVFYPLRNKFRIIAMFMGIALFSAGIFFYFQKDALGFYWFLYAVPLLIYGLYLFSMHLVSLVKGKTGIYLTDRSLVLKLATRKLNFEWDTIKGFRFTDRAGTRCIGIELFDPSKFIAGQKGITKAMSESSLRKDGVSFKIPVYAYKVAAIELWAELNHRLEKNRFRQQNENG